MEREESITLGAAEIARRFARGEVRALEVTEAHIARMEAVNARLNAVVVKRYDQARSEALEIDARRARGEMLGPLAGVPVTIKDSIDLAGLPSTFGLAWRRDERAPADDPHVARIRAAGAIVLGKTNVAQLLAYIESDNPVYGRTSNPWNAERTCGGSSGGEGAVIAAGGSALGLGTDIGGSVRYPAAFCGTASLKPTAGRCEDPGRWSFHVGQRAIVSQIGVLARNVEDVALGLQVINGGPAIPAWRDVDVRGLRIGFYLEDGMFRSAPAVKRAVRESAAMLRDAGASVVDWQPPDPARAYAIAWRIASGDGGRWFREALRNGPAHPSVKTMMLLAGRSRPTLRGIGALLRSLGQPTLAAATDLFGHTHVADYWRLVEQQQAYQREFEKAMNEAEGGAIDAIVGPACALPAFRHGTTRDLGIAGANTVQYNLLGYPAGIVPVTRVQADEESERSDSRDIVEKAAKQCEAGSAGLPIAVQVAARPWCEHVAFAAMQVIESAARKRPGYPDRPPI